MLCSYYVFIDIVHSFTLLKREPETFKSAFLMIAHATFYLEKEKPEQFKTNT